MSALKQQGGDKSHAAAAVSVRVGMTEGRGRGLFASAAMKKGATILIERPLVAMQSLDNAQDVTVCRNCLGFAGDVISQLEVLSGLPRHECLKRHQRRHDTNKTEVIRGIPSQGYVEIVRDRWSAAEMRDEDVLPIKRATFAEECHEKPEGTTSNKRPGLLSGLYECLQGCGEVYCSPDCRSEHLERCHRLLCVGPVPEEGAQDHPLVAFRVHAMQTNEIFLLVGEVMAQIATAFSKGPPPTKAANDDDGNNSSSGGDDLNLSAARAPFAGFVQEPWWDIAVPRDQDAAEDDECGAREGGGTAAPLADTLRALCEESSALLRSAFALALGPLPASLELALTAERFGRVVGMFEQNNVGVRAPSPIAEVLRELLVGGEGLLDRDARLGVLGEAAGLVGQIAEGEGCDDDDEEVVVSKSGGGCDDGQGCGGAAGTAVCGSSADENNVLKTAVMTSYSAPARAGGGFPTEEGGAVAVLRSAVDGSSGGDDLFAPLDGTALYSLVCCMNHSCRPNCVVRYPGRRWGTEESDPLVVAANADALVAEVVLLEDVSAEDELTQSYVTREMDLEERRRALEDYGFVCACPRCCSEEAALSS